MYEFLKTLILILISFNRVYSHEDDILVEIEMNNDNIELRSAIANFEALTSLFFKRGLKLNPDDGVANRIVDDMNVALTNIIELVGDQKQAQRFVKMKGFKKVIAPMFAIKRSDLKTLLLTLTRDLFRQTGPTMRGVVPVTYIDKMIDILEDGWGKNQLLCLDIMTHWLPGDVDAQTRVIRYRGLGPFYRLLSNLEPEYLKALLELFYKIIQEHKAALDEDTFMDENLVDKYRTMGFLQTISRRDSCYALLEIFENSPSMKKEDVMVPIIQLLNETTVLCADYYRGHPRVDAVCKSLLDYFWGDSRRLERMNAFLNMTDVKNLLSGCMQPVVVGDKEEL